MQPRGQSSKAGFLVFICLAAMALGVNSCANLDFAGDSGRIKTARQDSAFEGNIEGGPLTPSQVEEYRAAAFAGNSNAVEVLINHYLLTHQFFDAEKWATVAVVLKTEDDWMDIVQILEKKRGSPPTPNSRGNE